MEIKLGCALKINTDIPIILVESFQFFWKLDCHALLKLEGYLDRNVRWNPGECYDSRIEVCSENEEKKQIIYHGYIVKAEIRNVGETSQVWLEALSASCQLDRIVESRSFQNPKQTYGEVVREMVQADGGQLIRNKESDKEIKAPVIRNEETTWQFAKRMGRRLGIHIIPDLETGKPNIWFGMRNGKEVLTLPEDECTIQIRSIGERRKTRFQVKGRIFHKIGDRMIYLGQKVTVVEVNGCYEHGELTYLYTLDDRTVYQPYLQAENHPAGQGFWGVIKKVKDESVKIALDIDHGEDRGDYFYPWYPETGNALYAMPETGARALLHFFRDGEREGAGIHCLNKEQEDEHNYKTRTLDIESGNFVELSEGTVSFTRGGNHTIFLSDGAVSTSTSASLKIVAEGKIRLKAKRITINTPEELNLYQG